MSHHRGYNEVVEISRNQIGGIFGKGRQFLNKVEQTSGIQVVFEDNGSKLPIFRLIGRRDNVARAHQMILKRLEELTRAAVYDAFTQCDRMDSITEQHEKARHSPEPEAKAVRKNPVSRNPFATLAVSDSEQSEDEVSESVGSPKPTLARTPKPTSSKPRCKSRPKPTQSVETSATMSLDEYMSQQARPVLAASHARKVEECVDGMFAYRKPELEQASISASKNRKKSSGSSKKRGIPLEGILPQQSRIQTLKREAWLRRKAYEETAKEKAANEETRNSPHKFQFNPDATEFTMSQ